VALNDRYYAAAFCDEDDEVTMKTYSKRIAFLISDQHFIPHGGIGQFAKGFTEMCQRIGWKVDIVLDKSPTNDFSDLIKDLGANTIYPDEPLRYTDHTATFAFTDTINFEKVINFRKAILKGFETNLYDMVVCNTQEAMTAAYAMTINKYIPVVFYTHLHSMIFREAQNFTDVFLDSYHNFYNKHMEFSDIIIGTQSQKNIDELTKFGATNCQLLRMPMSERGLLEENNGQREGVLFIGRWEQGKNPDAYIRAMKDCKLPARVMTNKNGAKKFEKAFAENGITDYVIKAGIVGQEKVDFIKSCKVFFMPSLRENYPFAFLECLGHMPCVVLDTQDWSDNFDSKYYHKTSLANAGDTILRNYNFAPGAHYATGALLYVKQLDEQVAEGWIRFLDEFVAKRSNNNSAKINTYDTVKYADYIKDLNRNHLAREDFESVLSNRYKFLHVVYTDTDTWLSKDPCFKPVEEVLGIGLFEGL
jgi:glycosyltransferase involved in cell wall biosynthesis